MAHPTQYQAWIVQQGRTHEAVEFRRAVDGSISPIAETWPAGCPLPTDADLPSLEQAAALLITPPTLTPGERLYCQICGLLGLSVPATETDIQTAIGALPAEAQAGHLLTMAALSAMQDAIGYSMATTIQAKLAAGATLD